MKTRKSLLPIIGLIFAILLLAGCGSKPAEPTPVDFTGHWEDPASAFSLDLTQTGDKLQGGHAVVAQQGNKIDSMEKSIEGSVQGNAAEISFQSSFATNTGTATITSVDGNTILWKVKNPPSGEFYLPSEATLIKKSSASVPASAGTGTITGRVHLVAPPTPRMVIYAVDPTTGAWAFAETEATDSEASFSLVVPPGSYQLFGAVADAASTSVGYTIDGVTLAFVIVAANQTISDIYVRPPSQFECGSTMGYPASPDGRFAAVPGPAADCIAALTPSAGSVPPQANLAPSRIQFQPNATDWYTPGDLAPNASISFVLDAAQGQTMIVNLVTEPDSSMTPYATLYITAADGTIFTPNPTTSWSGVLHASQSYYIEVRSLSQQSINYTLSVSIPVTPPQSNIPAGGQYVPVTPEICQIIQELATQSTSLTFTVYPSEPFTDPITGEKGRGCLLTASVTGVQISDPNSTMSSLVNGFLGWTELPAYQAGGPTGMATGMNRDMALMLINVGWAPSPDANCPADQPISACNLKPKQKLYTVQIQTAMK